MFQKHYPLLGQVIEETHEFWLKLVGVDQPPLDPGALCTSTVSMNTSLRLADMTHLKKMTFIMVFQLSHNLNDLAVYYTQVTVDGSTRVSREEASGILAETPPITEGPETERSQHILHQNIHFCPFLSIVDKWHYAHLAK